MKKTNVLFMMAVSLVTSAGAFDGGRGITIALTEHDGVTTGIEVPVNQVTLTQCKKLFVTAANQKLFPAPESRAGDTVLSALPPDLVTGGKEILLVAK